MATIPVRDHEPAALRLRRISGQVGWGVLAWVVGIAFFLPVLWMVITAFKPESAAQTWPPKFVFSPTLAQFRLVFSGWGPYVTHSLIATTVSTVLVLVLGVPAAYALSVHPVPRWRDGLFFFISTKMLPVVAVIVPLYIITQHIGMLDNIWTLVVLYTAMNLPIAVWMLRSFLAEVPVEVLEAARVDGANLPRTLGSVVAPMVTPGIAAAALICFIFSWNELLFARVLTGTVAQTAPVFLTGFVTSQGLFLAKVCAASLAISLPVLAAGFGAQDKLVQGLSLGAIK